MTSRISSSRPITGSCFPDFTASFKFCAYCFNASYWFSWFWLVTRLPPLNFSILSCNTCFVTWCFNKNSLIGWLVSIKASTITSVAKYSSWNCCLISSAFVSNWYKDGLKLWPYWTWLPSTIGNWSIFSSTNFSNSEIGTWTSSYRFLTKWFEVKNTFHKCETSISWCFLFCAISCAWASDCCIIVVIFSIFILLPPFFFFHFFIKFLWCL